MQYFIQFTTLAAIAELSEARQLLAWKPWTQRRGRPTDAGQTARKYLEEVVDVLHFVGNLLTAFGVTDTELTQAYLRKMGRNLERQLAGYQGRVDTADGEE